MGVQQDGWSWNFAGNLDGFLWRVDHWAGHYESWQLVHNLFVAPQLGAWEVALKTWRESCKLTLLSRCFRHQNLGIILEDQVKHRKESPSVYNYGIVLLCSFSDIRHTHCQFCFQHSKLTKPFRNKNVPISRLFPQLSTVYHHPLDLEGHLPISMGFVTFFTPKDAAPDLKCSMICIQYVGSEVFTIHILTEHNFHQWHPTNVVRSQTVWTLPKDTKSMTEYVTVLKTKLDDQILLNHHLWGFHFSLP